MSYIKKNLGKENSIKKNKKLTVFSSKNKPLILVISP